MATNKYKNYKTYFYHKNINHLLAINNLPLELSVDIWHRYYTSSVLNEFLTTTTALETQRFNCQLDTHYTYMPPDNMLDTDTWRHMRTQFDEYLSFN